MALPEPAPDRAAPAQRVLLTEAAIVMAIGLGVAVLRSAVSFVAAVTAPGGLAAQPVTLNAPAYPDRPAIDAAWQLVGSLALLLPAVLAVHLLLRDSTWAQAGLSRARLPRRVAEGIGLAAVVGGAGLALFLVSRAAGLTADVQASVLGAAWWIVPLLVVRAFANAVLEEVLLAGYLLRRLDQAGVGPVRARWLSAGIRSAYHLYQGASGVIGNLVMGWLFAWLARRWGSVVPLIVAHTVIDVAAFVGYTYLVGRVSWL